MSSAAAPRPAAAGTDLEAVGVLADPLRREIVLRLSREELCTCHLVEMTGAAQPTVSYHLKILRDAGWVVAQPDGRYTYYRLEPGPVAELADVLATVSQDAARPRRRPTCD